MRIYHEHRETTGCRWLKVPLSDIAEAAVADEISTSSHMTLSDVYLVMSTVSIGSDPFFFGSEASHEKLRLGDGDSDADKFVRTLKSSGKEFSVAKTAFTDMDEDEFQEFPSKVRKLGPYNSKFVKRSIKESDVVVLSDGRLASVSFCGSDRILVSAEDSEVSSVPFDTFTLHIRDFYEGSDFTISTAKESDVLYERSGVLGVNPSDLTDGIVRNARLRRHADGALSVRVDELLGQQAWESVCGISPVDTEENGKKAVDEEVAGLPETARE